MLGRKRIVGRAGEYRRPHPIVLPSWQPPRVRPRIQNQPRLSPPLQSLSLSILPLCRHTPTAASLKIQSYLAQFKYEQPPESPEANVVAATDYASDDGACSHRSPWNRERNRGVPWTEEEHKLFLLGLRKVGKGDWRGIARNFVKTRTPTQVAAHAHRYFQRSKENLRVALSIRNLPFAQGIQPSDYTVLDEPSDYTGPEEIEATGFQICAEGLVSSPRKSINLEVVENVSLEVKSAYTGPDELEATGFQIYAEELVSSPRKSRFLEVVEKIYPEVKCDYTAPREVEATGFQICAEELVSSPRKCRFLEVAKVAVNVSKEITCCCCAFFEDLMGVY